MAAQLGNRLSNALGNQLGTSVSGTGAVSQRPPIPAAAIEYWHSELQCSSATWTGQIAGKVLSGVNTPTVAADPGFYKGRVVASSGAGKYFDSGATASLLASGQQPYLFVVSRNTLDASTGRMVCFANNAGASEELALYVDPTLSRVYARNPNSAFGGPLTAASGIHFFAGGYSGGVAEFSIDGVAQTPLGTGQATGATITQITVGAYLDGGNSPDATYAFVMLCSSKPSAGEISALRSWA